MTRTMEQILYGNCTGGVGVPMVKGYLGETDNQKESVELHWENGFYGRFTSYKGWRIADTGGEYTAANANGQRIKRIELSDILEAIDNA